MQEVLPEAQPGRKRRGQADDAYVHHLTLRCSTQVAGRRPDGPRRAWPVQSQPRGLPCCAIECRLLKCIMETSQVPVYCGSSLLSAPLCSLPWSLIFMTVFTKIGDPLWV